MKRTLSFSSLYIAILLLILSCNGSDKNETGALISKATASLTIEGMTCEIGCAGLIESKIANLDGVLKSEVRFEENLAVIEFNPDKVSEKELVASIEKINEGQYSVTDVKVEAKTSQNSNVTGKEGASSSSKEVSYTPHIKPIVFPDIFGILKFF